jgi:hypothetical protein
MLDPDGATGIADASRQFVVNPSAGQSVEDPLERPAVLHARR